MPLLDHFNSRLAETHPWESFHAAWANSIMAQLNARLPPRFFAVTQTHLSSRIEADVAEYDQQAGVAEGAGNGPAGGVAVKPWAPPAAAMVLPAIFPDEFEVLIHERRGGAVLVAVVELVSPGNKDRPDTRRAFAAKCATYLRRGIGLVVLDVVTERHANLHNELIDALGLGEGFRMPAAEFLYAVGYRPIRRQETNQIDVWPTALAVGARLPTVPLALRGATTIPLELEAAYEEARQRSRIP